MAHKKLKLEVELDTAKAKSKVKGLAAEGGGAGVSTAAPSTDRAARQIRELGDAAQGAKINMKEVTRAFAGVAVGMAANYAAKGMKAGAAKDAVEYGGSAVAGASMGMIAGPIGAAVGGAIGLLKTYLERETTKRQATEDFNRGEHDYASNRAFKKTIENLTDVGDAFENLDKNIAETQKQLEQYKKVEEELIAKVKQFRDKNDEQSAKIEEGYLAWNRSRQEALEGVLKSLEKQQKDAQKGPERIHETATDALAKVGGISGRTSLPAAAAATEATGAPAAAFGNLSFSVPARKMSTMKFGEPNGESATDHSIKVATETAAKIDAEILEVLKSIDGKSGVTWQ